MKIKPKTKKVCPRCGNKCLIAQERCEECDLVFGRLQYASNRAAKEKIRHFDTDFVIYTNQYPSDVSWWKLLMLAFLTGLVGGHYYYVGKYWKGGLMTTGFIYLIFCTIFNAEMVNAMTSYFAYFPIGILALSWLVSLIYVCFKKFKVPVIVELPDGEEKKEEPKQETHKKQEEKKDKEPEVVVINEVKK